MKYWPGVVVIALALAAAPALAGQESPRGPSAGYAFGNPRLLTNQMIWGRLHGVRLLGLACLSLGDNVAALAYVDWLDRQWPRIGAASRDLAQYYFHEDRAPLAAIDSVLKLRPTLDVPGEELPAACATFAEALAAPRNDLDRIYTERRAAILRGDPDFPGATWQESE